MLQVLVPRLEDMLDTIDMHCVQQINSMRYACGCMYTADMENKIIKFKSYSHLDDIVGSLFLSWPHICIDGEVFISFMFINNKPPVREHLLNTNLKTE